MAFKMTPKRATTTLKTTVGKQKVVASKLPPPFTLKIPVNIVRTLKCTGLWSWNVLNAFGTSLLQDLSYMRSPDPRGEKLHQRGLSSVSRLRSNYTQKREDVGNLCPFLRGEQRRWGLINFHPFQIAVYLTLFAISLRQGHKVDFSCLKKRVWFYCENQFISRVFQLILVKLFVCVCFYNNTSRFSLGTFTAKLN